MSNRIWNTSETVLLCRSCDAPVRFIISAKSGKKIICDAQEVVSDGTKPRLQLVTLDGQVVRNPPIGALGYTDHHATCYKSKDWKKKAQQEKQCA